MRPFSGHFFTQILHLHCYLPFTPTPPERAHFFCGCKKQYVQIVFVTCNVKPPNKHDFVICDNLPGDIRILCHNVPEDIRLICHMFLKILDYFVTMYLKILDSMAGLLKVGRSSRFSNICSCLKAEKL